MPAAVAAAIHDAYLALGAGAVAVRSSALAEDGVVASFAGQHETMLDVVGCDALLAAVRRCWLSLHSERARAYRRRLGRGGDAPLMAVVVQRMVPAVCSGVAFTQHPAHPVNGSRDVVVVEAVAGTGESLVSGRVTPSQYVVRRGDDPATVAGDLLDGERLTAVVRLARRVAAWAGRPQDVEWALDEAGSLYLLQARPITVAPGDSHEAVMRWTRDNVGEVLPDPVTPLSWSLLEPLGNRSFAALLRRLGIEDYPDAGLFGRFYGRVYFNQTLFQDMMSRFYPSHAGWQAAPRLALMGLRGWFLLQRLPAESDAVIADILAQRSAGGDMSTWRELSVRAMEVHLAVSVMGELFYQALGKLLSRWGGGVTTVAALTTGLTGVRSAEAGRALAALARRVGRDERVRTLLLTAEPAALPALLAETEAGRELWERIESFLAEHGHSAAQEFELAAPRWRDDPAIILSALRAQVRAAGDPRADPTADRLAATARVEQRLGPLQRRIFRFLLRRAQSLTMTRENLKYHFVIAHSRLRDLYLALAEQFVAAGQLSDPDDIFFLTAAEVAALSESGLEEVAVRLAERRRAWEDDCRVRPPFAIEQRNGRLHPSSPPAASVGDEGVLLRGFAASPGSYTGRARVVLAPGNGAGLEPGEVLVAPATSPGWAPLFLAAGALVTEIGGTLSHGAIIAREYGLPAVLNVIGATRHIHTGQLVHVDGSRGVVRLLEEAT